MQIMYTMAIILVNPVLRLFGRFQVFIP